MYLSMLLFLHVHVILYMSSGAASEFMMGKKRGIGTYDENTIPSSVEEVLDRVRSGPMNAGLIQAENGAMVRGQETTDATVTRKARTNDDMSPGSDK